MRLHGSYVRALLVGVDIVGEDAGLEVSMINMNPGGLAFGDALSAGRKEDQAVKHVILIEEFVLDNLQHLL